MHFRHVVLALFVCAACAPALQAQIRPDDRAYTIFSDEARTAAVETVESLGFDTRRTTTARVDEENGVLRAMYAVEAGIAGEAHDSPTQSARAALLRHEDKLGLQGGGTLVVVRVVSTSVSHHVLLQQNIDGLPVYRRYVKVNLDRDLRPTMILNGVDPGLAERSGLMRASLSPVAAREIASSIVVRGSAASSEPELMLYPGSEPFPVWRIVLWPSDAPGEWEVLVHARTGKVVHLLDQTIAHNRVAADVGESYRRGVEESVQGSAAVNGSGYVFDPDPITVAGVAYGPPYVDNGDQTSPQLDNQRVSVPLLDITFGNDAKYRLEGPHVRIIGGGSLSPPFVPPAENSADAFHYTRDLSGFEAVMAYYHVDKSQRYVQSLGFTELQNAPLKVNPRAFSSDNSFYTPGQNLVEFGIGGVDDAEDAGVIWHEYGHALLEGASAGLSVTDEGDALHEGWSDYWAGSYLRLLADTQVGKRTDWENVFRWDSGDGQIWPGRSLTKPGTYPETTTCEDPNDINGDGCGIHSDGLLWGTTLMEIYTDLGKTVTDQLVLQSHYYLMSPVTFVDAAEAVVQADRDLFGGIHTSALINRLSTRGYLDAANFGPIVSHEPLRSTESLGGTVELRVQASPTSAPIGSVVAYHRLQGESSFTALPLASAGGDMYADDLNLPFTPSTVEYYVEAVDDNSLQARLPANAPEAYFSFDVGPDNTPPVITHIPISSTSRALWPPPVIASVDDNLGIDSVWVNFELEDSAGMTYRVGSFGLVEVGTNYRAPFPVAVVDVRIGTLVRYAIVARDAAVLGNESADPVTGFHSFPVEFSGVLAAFDFESSDGDLKATGVWAHGPPDNTLQVAHSGSNTWRSGSGGPYPAFPQLSTLELPPLNLQGLPEAYLILWHWHDFEYRGTPLPGEPLQGSIWDGGNIKMSVDGGNTWAVVTPDGGYSGLVAPSETNPLEGESAFGAISFGWRREIIALPIQNDVRIRFDFGTDASNSEQSINFAGWYIDDIVIVTDRPSDTEAPAYLSLPRATIVQPVGEGIPPIAASFTDNTGIASLYADYEVVGSSPASGSVPLSMAHDDLSQFSGTFPPGMQFVAGDRLEYRLRATDFDGNTLIAPAPSEAKLAIEFRTVSATVVLRDVVPTGHWVRNGSVWTVDSQQDVTPVSSLVIPPMTLPADVSDLYLGLLHSYSMGDQVGANVHLSADDGRTWSVLRPDGGYPSRFNVGGHPMNGQDVYSGSSGGELTSFFDLTAHAGRQVRFRFDFGAARVWDATEFWTVIDAAVIATSTADTIEVPDQLSLSANFPDPFSDRTTISYVLPERMHVRVDVYDTLGRLVALLANGVRDKGAHTVTFEARDLAAGLYFARIDAGGERKVERMVIVR